MRAQVPDDESGPERDPPGDGLGEAGGDVAGGRDLAARAHLSLQHGWPGPRLSLQLPGSDCSHRCHSGPVSARQCCHELFELFK